MNCCRLAGWPVASRHFLSYYFPFHKPVFLLTRGRDLLRPLHFNVKVSAHIRAIFPGKDSCMLHVK